MEGLTTAVLRITARVNGLTAWPTRADSVGGSLPRRLRGNRYHAGLAAAGLSAAAVQRKAGAAVLRPVIHSAKSALVMAAAAGFTPGLIGGTILVFLLVLIVLLVLSILAIVVQPQEQTTSGADALAAASAQAESGGLLAGPSLAGAAVPLPRRAAGPPDQKSSDHRGYTARHSSGPTPTYQPAGRPRVSGGPPWDPAPKPPGIL